MRARVEVAGIIGSGKTTFARLFTETSGTQVVFESFRRNPFWKAFYADPAGVAFETELSFLLLHAFEARAGSAGLVVCDYSMLLDRAYSEVTLTDSQKEAFRTVETCLLRQDPCVTRVVVWMRCEPKVALERLRRRGRRAERGISLQYLAALDSALTGVLSRANLPIIEVDAGGVDCRTRNPHVERLVEQVVATATTGRLLET